MKKSNAKLYSALWILFNGIVISLIAGYISVFGMIAIFGGHALVVGLMIGSMEVGKLTSATWLKLNWSNPTIGILHKSYLIAAVLILTVLTAIGVYGFMSAAHLEQKAPLAGLDIQSAQFETRLKQKTDENNRLIQRLDQIDKNIGVFLEKGNASKGLAASKSLKTERDKLSQQMDANNTEINDLNEKLAPIKQKSSMVEAKLGPVKYLAQLIGYGDNPEVAVQIVILMIMIPFDPLAVVLVLSGMMTLNQWREEQGRSNENDIELQWAERGMDDFEELIGAPEIETNPEATRNPDPEPIQGNTHEQRIADLDNIFNPGAFSEPEPESKPEPEVESPVDEKTEETDISEAVKDNDNLLLDLNARLERGSLTNEELIDMLEEHPSIISDLIAIVKDMEVDSKNVRVTPTQLTGGTFDA